MCIRSGGVVAQWFCITPCCEFKSEDCQIATVGLLNSTVNLNEQNSKNVHAM